MKYVHIPFQIFLNFELLLTKAPPVTWSINCLPLNLNNLPQLINDIDGPNNEALSTKCNESLEALATSEETNLILDNKPRR